VHYCGGTLESGGWATYGVFAQGRLLLWLWRIVFLGGRLVGRESRLCLGVLAPYCVLVWINS